MTTSAGPVLTNYSGYYSDYKTYNGITVPSHLEAEWNLDNQDFRYGKFTVTGFEYDNFSEFE